MLLDKFDRFEVVRLNKDRYLVKNMCIVARDNDLFMDEGEDYLTKNELANLMDQFLFDTYDFKFRSKQVNDNGERNSS